MNGKDKGKREGTTDNVLHTVLYHSRTEMELKKEKKHEEHKEWP